MAEEAGHYLAFRAAREARTPHSHRERDVQPACPVRPGLAIVLRHRAGDRSGDEQEAAKGRIAVARSEVIVADQRERSTSQIFSPGPTSNTVRASDGRVLTIPDGWALLPPGDAALTRRVKAAGDHWTVQEK